MVTEKLEELDAARIKTTKQVAQAKNDLYRADKVAQRSASRLKQLEQADKAKEAAALRRAEKAATVDTAESGDTVSTEAAAVTTKVHERRLSRARSSVQERHASKTPLRERLDESDCSSAVPAGASLTDREQLDMSLSQLYEFVAESHRAKRIRMNQWRWI